MGALRGVMRLAGFLLLILLIAPFQIATLALRRGHPASYALPLLFHKIVTRLFGLRVEIIGTPVTGQQALYVFNHVSYLDIPVIGSVLPASFVAKKDVAGWPVFGLLARLSQTAFISRKSRDSGHASGVLAAMIRRGQSLIIFPEGTSSDGRQVLPFKSSLFGIALAGQTARPLLIQPATLSLCAVNGAPVTTPAQRDLYAWYGDMTLVPHLWTFAKRRGAIVRLHFHPPLAAQDFSGRKMLAQSCYSAVAGALESDFAKAA